jgi:SpoVK/Ycf46/Vps4 family AAA+-type ATPase
VENKAKAMAELGLDPKKSKDFTKEELGKLGRLALSPEWLRKAKSKRIKEQSGAALEFVDVGDAAKLGGADVLQEWVGIAKSRFASGKAAEYALGEPKGMVIVGVPGTGKSLTPKNIARDWGVPLIRLDIGALFGGVVGATEANVRNILKSIEACAPCVLWVDEIEKAIGGKGDGPQGDSGVSTRLVGAFLTWLQENKKPVFMVATANSVEQLRIELLRKGRVDQIYFVDLPDYDERVAIATIHINKKARPVNGVGDIDPKEFAKMTDGFSGAEMEQVLYEAMGKAFSQDGRKTTIDDLRAEVADTTPMKVMMAKDIERIRQWARDNKAKYANRKAAAKAESEKTGRRMNLGGDAFGDSKFEAK